MNRQGVSFMESFFIALLVLSFGVLAINKIFPVSQKSDISSVRKANHDVREKLAQAIEEMEEYQGEIMSKLEGLEKIENRLDRFDELVDENKHVASANKLEIDNLKDNSIRYAQELSQQKLSLAKELDVKITNMARPLLVKLLRDNKPRKTYTFIRQKKVKGGGYLRETTKQNIPFKTKKKSAPRKKAVRKKRTTVMR